jgi:hypothetical protein
MNRVTEMQVAKEILMDTPHKHRVGLKILGYLVTTI